MRKISLVCLIFFILPAFASATVVNINTADAVLLDTLPGIGPSKAAAIIEYRTTHGLFANIEDIQNVKGIGPSTFAGFKALIIVDTPAESSIQASPPKSEGLGGKLSPPTVSTNKEQTVTHDATPPPTQTGRGADQSIGSANTTSVSETAHAEEAISAPGTTSELAAPGALVHTAPANARTSSILHSPWMLGFLGVIVLAGGALMIL